MINVTIKTINKLDFIIFVVGGQNLIKLQFVFFTDEGKKSSIVNNDFCKNKVNGVKGN